MRLSSSRSTAILHRPQQDFVLWDKAGTRPSLDLQFADRKDLVDATTGSNLVDFTRASSGTYVGSDGLIKTATTNLLLQSEDFSTTWIKGGNTTLTPNYGTAPNGTAPADRVEMPNNIGTVVTQAVTTVPGLPYVFSVYARATSGTSPLVLVLGTASQVFTLTESWQRYSISFTATGASTDAQLDNGSNAIDVLAWGAQLEQSSTVGEYIPTTSTINSAPRFDHDPVTGESLGLLVEESRTNLVLQSEDFSTTWVSGAPYSVATNTAISPDGTQNADSIIVANGSSSFDINVTRQVVTKAASAIQYTRSGYFKAIGSTTSVRLIDFGSGTSSNASVVISLVDGSVLGSPSVFGAFTGASVSVSLAGNGWYRIAFTYTSDTATSLTIRSFPYVGINQLTGDGTSGLLVWGAQLEQSSYPTSYIPTTSSTVTRAADVASISGSNFSGWYNQSEGSVFGDTSSFNSDTSKNTSGWGIDADDTTGQNRIWFYHNKNQYIGSASGSTQYSLDFSSVQAGVRVKSGFSYKENDIAASSNGFTPLVDSVATLPTVDRLFIGKVGFSGTELNGHIRRLVYWDQRLPNDTLETITQ